MRALVFTLIAVALAGCQAPDRSDAPAARVGAEATATRTPAEIQAFKDAELASFLKSYAREAMQPLRYVAVEPAENNPQHLTFVYLMGPEYCGSGGCKLLVLSAMDAGGYGVHGEITIARPPVMMLGTSTNGMPDLAVSVSGGGVTPHVAVLRYDDGYPGNPTVPPAQPATAPLAGQTVISEEMLRLTAIDLPE